MEESILIRSPYNNIEFIDDLFKFESYMNFEKKILLENEIENEKSHVIDIIFTKIPLIDCKLLSRKFLNQKRKIFNSLGPFDFNIISENSCLFDSKEMVCIEKHYINRVQLMNIEASIIEMLNKEKKELEDKIYELLKENDWFKSAILISNPNLYKSIYQGKNIKLDKNKFITLLRYIYKSSLMPTPSSLWAGVNIAKWGEKNHFIRDETSQQLSFEYNIKKIKHTVRNLSKSNFTYMFNDFFYVNPTIFYEEGYLFYWKVGESSFKKCRVKNNNVLQSLLSTYKNKKFKLSSLKKNLCEYMPLENTDPFIHQLLNMDLLRIKADPLYGTANPFEDVKTILKNEEMEYLISKKHQIANSTLREDFVRLCNFDIGTDSAVRVNSINGWKELVLKDEIKKGLKEANNIYQKLYNALYSESLNNSTRKEDFAAQYGYDVLIPILKYSFDREKIKPPSYNIENYRAWKKPGDIKSLAIYNKLIHTIKNKIEGNAQIIILKEELEKIFSDSNFFSTTSDKKNYEIIYQLYKKDQYFFIPEMYSTIYGRLTGRFIKLFNEEIQYKLYKQLIEEIDNQKMLVQTNIHINNNLDGLGFDNPLIDKKLMLYDYNYKNEENVIFINELFIKLDKETQKFSAHLSDGTAIDLWNSSSISPGNDALYNLLNYIPHQDVANLNGHAKSRLELDLDYQPRILIDNLVISRERYRFKKENFDFIDDNISINEKMKCLFTFLNQYQLPEECFMYTDTNFKPQYVRFKSIYDLYIVQRILKENNKYVYIEECLPSKEDYWLKTQNEKFNAEVWSKYE